MDNLCDWKTWFPLISIGPPANQSHCAAHYHTADSCFYSFKNFNLSLYAAQIYQRIGKRVKHSPVNSCLNQVYLFLVSNSLRNPDISLGITKGVCSCIALLKLHNRFTWLLHRADKHIGDMGEPKRETLLKRERD